MMLLFTVTLFLLLYAALIFFYWYHWLNSPSFATEAIADVIVSVVVAARNEEKGLPFLLSALQQQTYPKHLFEVIIVDDYSTDNTQQAIQLFLNERVRLIQPNTAKESSSKKKAIETGVNAASGELIIITDADCVVPEKWLQTITAFYRKTKPSFIAAPVRLTHNNSLLQLLQAMDFMVLQGITASAVSSHFHTMANGANLAYTKQAFDEVDGFEEIDTVASGDDMLLMQKLWQKNKHAVAYLKSEDAIVVTEPMQTWKSFINQRKRWASKSSVYTDSKLKAVLVFVYLFNVLFFILLMASLINPNHWYLFFYYLLGKTAIEFSFVSSIAKFFKEQKLLKYFIFLQPIHIVYTVVVGFISQFGKYEWKGRQTK
jgi:cellulose synthase/poly-beta-1,6-N-acetylglucosamine synthase-like glycosyltransferase